MFDERRFLPEIARLVFIWRQHGAAPASAEVLCHWASAAVAWTRTPPRPMEAINSLRLLGLLNTNAAGEYVPGTSLQAVLQGTGTESDPELLPVGLTASLFERMLSCEQLQPSIERAFAHCRVYAGVPTVEWNTLAADEKRNIAWIWLQQLGLATHTGSILQCDASLVQFVLDVPTTAGALSQAELDRRLAMQRARAVLAEQYVIDKEKERLASLGLPEYAEGVIRISDDDVAAGYDIVSFDASGARRFIEVKSCCGPRRMFFWSSNEFRVARQMGDGYWLAWIGWANRLPSGPVELAWFHNPASILQVDGSPWQAESQDYRVVRIADDREFMATA